MPEHHLLTKKESDEVLERLKVGKDQLPKIKMSDPVIQILERLHGPIESGSIVKVVRESPTAGVAVVYRLVVPG